MLALCLFLCSCGLFNYGEKEDVVALSTPIKVEYKMYQVIRGDIKRELTGTCSVTSFGAVKYSFSVGGYALEGYSVRSGQAVKKGDVLATMKVDAAVQRIEEIDRELDAGGLNSLAKRVLQAERSYMEKVVADKEIVSTVDGTVRYINTKFTIGRDQNVEITPGEIMVVVDPEIMSDAQGVMILESSVAKKYTIGLHSDVTLTTSSAASADRKSFHGKIVGASNSVTWDSDTITYYIDLSEAPEGIKVGDRLSVRFEEDNQAIGVLKIPTSALYSFEGRNFVYVLDSQGLRRECYVEIGISDDSFVEIKAGLEAGQQIVQY